MCYRKDQWQQKKRVAKEELFLNVRGNTVEDY